MMTEADGPIYFDFTAHSLLYSIYLTYAWSLVCFSNIGLSIVDLKMEHVVNIKINITFSMTSDTDVFYNAAEESRLDVQSIWFWG